MKKRFTGLKKKLIDGKFVYFAYAFGKWVEISEEIYKEMARSERRERYHYACCRDLGIVSLDQMVERMDDSTDSVPLCDALIENSPEDEYIRDETSSMNAKQVKEIKHAIGKLEGNEFELASSILLEGKSMRRFAEEHGLTRKTVRYHFYAVCKKIREMCIEEEDHAADN